MKTFAVFALTAVLPMLAACGERDSASAPQDPAATAKPADTMIGRRVAQAMDKARVKLAKENIKLSDVHVSGNGVNIDTGDGNDGRPGAEITPQGDLLIEGRKIDATPEQHALLLDYRKQIEGIASAGMDIGTAGAELGVKAATEVLKGVFSGNTGDIERRVEAEAEKIKASTVKLCDRLPAMLETQTRLAAVMPEFRPYATMDKSDIDDCYEEGRTAGADIGAGVTREVSASIGEAVRASGSADEGEEAPAANAAAEAEAAGAERN